MRRGNLISTQSVTSEHNISSASPYSTTQAEVSNTEAGAPVARRQIVFPVRGLVLRRRQKLYLPFKRMVDIFISLIMLILFSPIFLIVSIAIRIEDGGPTIYRQTRVGKNKKEFQMYKFRSMCCGADAMLDKLQHMNEADGPVFKIADDPRVTRVGHFIRKFSIDELPQLLNILKGEMTIVGPRPPLPNEVAKYTPEQALRLAVKPGLTCFWQVSGRSNLSFERWMELDRQYLRELGPITDLKILLKTIPAVLSGIGAS